jgi:hypothetical protein
MNTTDFRPALPKPDRPARHGLIEDWRDGLWVLLLMLVAAFSGALIVRYLPTGDDDATVAQLNTRIDALEATVSKDRPRELTTLKDRVTKIETRQKSIETALAAGQLGSSLAAIGPSLLPGAATGATPQLGAPATDVATRLSALEKQATAATLAKQALDKLTETIGAVDTRLTKLENSDILELARRAALANAIANLQRAAQGSSPFKTEFGVVAAMMPGEARLASIAPYAEKGLPTVSTLAGTFPNIADAARDAEDAAKGRTFVEKLWANFTSLISIRSVGETEGHSTDARLARGEVRLKAGDLAAAVKELATIGGAARDTLAPWMDQAKSRVAVEAALADINTRAIEALTGPVDSKDPVPQLPHP